MADATDSPFERRPEDFGDDPRHHLPGRALKDTYLDAGLGLETFGECLDEIGGSCRINRDPRLGQGGAIRQRER